jgi:peroxiredoxin
MATPVQPGEHAPGFSLPAVNREGMVSLADFRGRALMIGFFRGLHCPFCRRQIAQLGAAQPGLAALGVDTVAVINTPLERARLYFRYRPTPVTLLSDPDCASHAAFGIPRIEFLEPGAPPGRWPRTRMEEFAAARVDPTGELGTPTQPMEANAVLNRKDGFEPAPEDQAIFERHGTQFAGQFLIGSDGLVRWGWTEAAHSADEIGRFPGVADMLAIARAYPLARER